MYKIEVFDTIDEISKESIDSMSEDGFFTYEWFKTLETSKPFKIIPRYFVVYEEERIVSIAPCFIEYSSLFLTFENLSPVMKGLRKVSSRLGLSMTPPLVCNSPCSFHTKVLFDKSSDAKIALNLVSTKIDDTCRKQGTLFSIFPYVTESDTFLVNTLPGFGYFKIPYMKIANLKIEWSSFEGYLKSFKIKTRHEIRREMEKNKQYGIEIEQIENYNSLSFVLSKLYSNLFTKYRGNGNSLNSLFFEKLYQYASNKTKVFVAKKENRIIGFSLCLVHGGILDVYIVGFDYQYLTKKDFTYFNVGYYVPIRYSIENRIPEMHLNASGLYAKSKRGCKIEKTYMFVKCHSKLLNSIPFLRYLIFFPFYLIGRFYVE